MTRPDSPFVADHVTYLRASGEWCLRRRRLPLARAFYVLAARWTRYAFDAAERDDDDDARNRAALARESVRLSGRMAP